MDSLVIGLGEVGRALASVLKCDARDIEYHPGEYNTLHIAFGYHEGFEDTVKRYQDLHESSLVVVHSTVPVGTCDPEGWVHSPVRGKHPDLEESIRTFPKLFGGYRAEEAALEFSAVGVEVGTTNLAKTTELGKLVELSQYGVEIVMEKVVHDLCDQYGVPFETVYTQMSRGYNRGYSALGLEDVVKPVLKHMEGPIGGHCVSPGVELLGDEWFLSATEGYRSVRSAIGIPV